MHRGYIKGNVMGLTKVAVNFAERGGKYFTSLLCSKPKVITNLKGLKYVPFEESSNAVRKPGMILNTKTGMQEPIEMDMIDCIPKDRHIDLSAYNTAGDEIGIVRLKDDPTNEYTEFIGIKGQDCLYIDFWATSPNYKGIGREMLKKIVQISKRSGYGGRVSLSASTGSIPMKFGRICGPGKSDVSCAIKYKKMGFNAVTPEMDLKINETIAKGESGLVIDPDNPQHFKEGLACKMELSPEAIKKYLNLECIT